MMDPSYSYLLMLALFGGVWAVVFAGRPSLRRKMLVMSGGSSCFGPLAGFLHTRDYWHPPYVWDTGPWHAEDVLAAFLVAGVGSVLFDAASPATYERVKNGSSREFGLMVIGGWAAVLVLTIGSGVNSVMAMSTVSLSLGSYVVARRRDLLRGAIGNGLLLAGVLWLTYLVVLLASPDVFRTYWKIASLSGFSLAGVPAEELLWGFTTGFAVWPVYPFFAGLRPLEPSARAAR